MNVSASSTISTSPNIFENAIKSQFARYSKNAKIPGFRQGKVPEKMLEQQFGGSALKDAVDKLINEADQMLSQDQAKTAKENYETAKKTVAPVQEDFAPNHKATEPLIAHADRQLQRLKHAMEQTRAEMESVKQAIDTYEYKTAADLMLANKPARRWAFDLDEKLAKEFQQLVQNNQKIIEIVYPNHSLKP